MNYLKVVFGNINEFICAAVKRGAKFSVIKVIVTTWQYWEFMEIALEIGFMIESSICNQNTDLLNPCHGCCSIKTKAIAEMLLLIHVKAQSFYCFPVISYFHLMQQLRLG